MEKIPQNSLIIITEEDVKRNREAYGMPDPAAIRDCLKVVKEWCEKQSHLAEAAKHLDNNVLERIFLLARCSTEATKIKIDKLFTARGLMPEMFLHRSMEDLDSLLNCINYVPLPKLTPDGCRVMVTQFKPENLDNLNFLHYFKYAFLLGEYRMFCDYSFSERYVIDLKYAHLSVLGKLNPIVLKKADLLCKEAFGTKIKGIHIVNAASFVDKVVFLLKTALRDKVASRIHIHTNYESLQEFIPKDILPKDYGGDEESCNELQEKWRETLNSKEGQRIIAELEHFVSDESQRKESTFNVEYLGMPGSFRKLNVD